MARATASQFNALPDLETANEAVQRAFAAGLAPRLLQLFLDFGVQNVFGLALVHRHFSLEPGELLVGDGNVSIPVQQHLVDDIAPTRWTADGLPYEFALHKPFIDVAQHAGFVTALHDLLLQHNLDQYLGLSTLEARPTVEITIDRANVTLSFNPHPGGTTIEAAWSIGDTLVPDRRCYQVCTKIPGPGNGHCVVHL